MSITLRPSSNDDLISDLILSIRGVFMQNHGWCLKAGKYNAMRTGSCIAHGQKDKFAGTSIIRSAALWTCDLHMGVDSRGTTNT